MYISSYMEDPGKVQNNQDGQTPVLSKRVGKNSLRGQSTRNRTVTQSQSMNKFKTLIGLEGLLKLLLAVSEQPLAQTTSHKQGIRLKSFNSPLKCFSRDSCMLAWVWEHSWLVASCFFISPVIALPRLSNSTEWYFRHRPLRFSWVELMFFC